MSPDAYYLLLVVLGIALVLSVISFKVSGAKYKRAAENSEKEFREKLSRKDGELRNSQKDFNKYREETDALKKYIPISDIEAELERIKEAIILLQESAQAESNRITTEANEAATLELKESRAKAKEIREKAEAKMTEAHFLATKIEEDAKIHAKEIAGTAWEAKEKAEQYEATVKAMKNIIKGYGDEYLIPNQSILDELAEEYDHKEAGQQLAKIRTLIKSMIKNQEAAECDYVEPYRRSKAIEFVLDAFNGKVDTIMSKVKHDNYGKLKQQLEDAFRLVNINGEAFKNARIVSRYFNVMEEQLKMAIAVQELKRIDQEEQRKIKEQIREEERARKEFEKAIRETEKEEKMLQKAMTEARKKLEDANQGVIVKSGVWAHS